MINGFYLDYLKHILMYDEKENEGLFMPNEIFVDFPNDIEPRSSSTVAFAYSYYYLISYLYRFAKYGEREYNVKDIKEILRYSKTNKTMDYLIKENGVLDSMGYTKRERDFPIMWFINSMFNDYVYLDNYDEGDLVIFSESDLPKVFSKDELEVVKKHGNFPNKRNKTVKVPLLGLNRFSGDLGTFYDIKNTTMIPVEAFIHCMSTDELGVEGFWIYSYIKHKSEYFGGRYTRSLGKMVGDTTVKEKKIGKVLKALETYNMITNDHKPFVMGKPDDILVEPCSYSASDSWLFVRSRKEVESRKVISFKQYAWENNIDIEKHEGKMFFASEKCRQSPPICA